MNKIVLLPPKELIVVLEPDRWERLWKEMCDDLGYIPSWDEYPKYFGCAVCRPFPVNDYASKFQAIFRTKEEALLFKLTRG